MFTLLRDATLALYADTVFPRRLLVPHFFEISDEFRRNLWVVVKFASVEMNVHSWQGLVAGTCGHQTRYLDQRSAQNPKCIVLLAKMSLQDFTTSSGQKDLHAWISMPVLVRGSNRILISHTLIWGFPISKGIVSDFPYLMGLTIQKKCCIFYQWAVSFVPRFLGVRFLRGEIWV